MFRSIWHRHGTLEQSHRSTTWRAFGAPSKRGLPHMNKPGKLDAFAENAEQTARRGQMIQEEVDRAGKKGAARTETRNGAMQAGARPYPDSFPKQHLKKPG